MKLLIFVVFSTPQSPRFSQIRISSSAPYSQTPSDYGAVQRTAPQGSPRTPAKCIAATTPGLIVTILKFWF